MIKGEQIRAARMLLKWDVSTLARSASVEEAILLKMEEGDDAPDENRDLIQQTLETAGLEFPDHETVRFKQPR